MKTIAALEHMKTCSAPMFGNQYEFLMNLLEDYYISKLDGMKRIENELSDWNQEAQTVIVNELVRRLNETKGLVEPDELLSLIRFD